MNISVNALHKGHENNDNNNENKLPDQEYSPSLYWVLFKKGVGIT
jgi:hypothetical protein